MNPSTSFAPSVRAVLGLAVIALCASGAPNAATAQSAAPATPTFVAIPVTFPDVDARAIVIREPDQDLILLAPGEVTADALFMALVVLDRMRSAQPMLKHGQIAPISGFSVDGSLRGRDRGRLEAVLTRLERQPETDLGTLGLGRLVSYTAESAPR